MGWLKSLTLAGKLITFAVAVALLVAAFFAVRALFIGGLETEVKLGRNTTEAALESGRDAVGTVGAQGAAEDAVDTITEENENAIRNAEGADASVAPAADAAGRASLCKRAAYRERPECMQLASPR